MATFQFQGRDQQGQLVTGQRDGASQQAVAELLVQEAIIPVTIVAEVNAEQATSTSKFFRNKKVKLDDLMMFSRQMYTLTKAGIPLTNAVSRLAQTSHSAPLSEALRQIVIQIEAGNTLASAMQQFPKIFSQLFISIIHVGENIGRLDKAFLEIGKYLELESKTLKRIKSALRYPTIVISAIVGAIVVINLMVIPSFAKMFANFNTELPWATRLLLSTSNFMVAHWLFLLLATGLLSTALLYYLRTPKGGMNWHRLQLKIPAIGSIIERVLLARFCRTFAVLLSAGIPVDQAINLVGHTVGNRYLQKSILQMHQSISYGQNLYHAARQTELFSPLVLQMLAVGEETGQVSDMLDEVAGFYENEVDYDLQRVGDALEPILLVLVGIMVLILALGVFLPMWDMSNLSGR